MTWPSDGKPRFVVSEIAGAPIGRDGKARRGSATLEASVLDRGYCFRPVYVTRARSYALARNRAALRCKVLNSIHPSCAPTLFAPNQDSRMTPLEHPARSDQDLAPRNESSVV